MTDLSRIKTLVEETQNKMKEKSSSFLGFAFIVDSEENAFEKIKELKKKHYDATHHCYAIKLNSGFEKYSDDGEPTGTAGIRILSAISHFGITNILVVVVRYFGGIKLGVGPLGKAYSTCANELLLNSKIIESIKYEKIEIHYNYNETSKIHYLLKKYECQKVSEKFEKSPIISCFLIPDKIKNFEIELNDVLNGKSGLKRINEEMYLELDNIKI
ncbi:MAG: YigZ family protein [Ignavibacteriales bacterium]|nr:YigZ family protein [Ignavibacteriales bacterium]